MSLGYLEIIRIAADCFQILLGVVLVFLLIRHLRKPAKPDSASRAAAQTGPFMHEFMLQSLKHQSDMSFDHIEKTILAERRNLLRLFEISHENSEEAADPALCEDAHEEIFQMDGHESEAPGDSSSKQYLQVAQLATDGLKAPRIAKQLGIPRGEVELVLKMAAADKMTTGNPPSAFWGD